VPAGNRLRVCLSQRPEMERFFATPFARRRHGEQIITWKRTSRKRLQ
jgi:hypothetical protein